jgi:predicted nucleotidyltransferase
MPAPVPIADALFGKARQAVLALLFGHPERAFYTREIIGAANVGASQVQSELDRLTRAGLLTREARGNQVHYRVNKNASVYPELLGLVTKSFGVADVLRHALARFDDRIELALIYGSIADGSPSATSDVDVLLVTPLLLSDLEPALNEAESKLGRKVSVTLLEPREFRDRMKARDHFLSSVLARPTIFLMGDQSLIATKRGRKSR